MAEADEQPDETHGDEAARDVEQVTGDSSVSNLQLEVNEQIEPDDGEDFTLATLSEAYADVVRSEGDGDDEVTEADPEEGEPHESPTTTANQDDDAACPISPCLLYTSPSPRDRG